MNSFLLMKAVLTHLLVDKIANDMKQRIPTTKGGYVQQAGAQSNT
jgi:hypothetical protein